MNHANRLTKIRHENRKTTLQTIRELHGHNQASMAFYFFHFSSSLARYLARCLELGFSPADTYKTHLHNSYVDLPVATISH